MSVTSLEMVVGAVVMGGMRYAILETHGPLHRLGDALGR
jgi:hypothetical protein